MKNNAQATTSFLTLQAGRASDPAVARALRGAAKRQLGRAEEAERDVARALSLAPDNPEALLERGALEPVLGSVHDLADAAAVGDEVRRVRPAGCVHLAAVAAVAVVVAATAVGDVTASVAASAVSAPSPVAASSASARRPASPVAASAPRSAPARAAVVAGAPAAAATAPVAATARS